MTFTTKKVADGWLAGVQSDIERGVWKSPAQLEEEAAEAARIAAGQTTVRELAEVWLSTIPSLSHRSLSASRVRRFILPEFGDLAVTDLTREMCDEWFVDLCPEHPTQRRRVYAALSAILGVAIDRQLIAAKPLRIKGALNDVPAREPQTASVAEVDSLAGEMPARLKMAIPIAAWCGLRAGEVVGLQRRDAVVDPASPAPFAPTIRLMLRRRVIHGRGTGGAKVEAGTKAEKSTESVTVPPHLSVALWKHLRDHVGPAPTAWLFTAAGSADLPCSPDTLRESWNRARKATGLEHLTFHDLRRTGNTLAALAGATPGELKQRLRHKTSAAAERYIVAAQGADAQLAARMSAQLRR
ncbi:tyrosine-type recombinase/integrase [Mycolicibacter virginiensis]|uniref:tyrosine-type recombinase/integrase n=1 Tax=Mycolicibacter virginiensis TaxID=1795032 RepID=UPI001F04620F|nr:site-specific integrase [Mycolicibacter virginiensis]ULP48006.1 site-specific integrase [Mycolicibacter virginiensis]